MTTQKLKIKVIPKEKAVFWLDKNGRWHNKDGAFEHRKIIKFFHSAIKKDKDGYYLSQDLDTHTEKVYFKYEETALFVFDIIKHEEEIILVLNTKKRIRLEPEKLFIKDDSLYMNAGEELIKFDDRSMMKISDMLEFDEERYFIKIKDEKYQIRFLNPI